jgi:glutamate synthase (NADPH/NADH) small chain
MKFLVAPKRAVGKDGKVTGVECTRMELGEPDEKGRCSVTPIACSEFDMDTDTVIVAIGQTPNPIIQRTTGGLRTNPRNGTIIVDEDGRTNLPGVFAGGDVATGAATVISAMGAGKRAAKAMHDYLMNGKGAGQ